MFPQSNREKTWQPWGFEAVSREAGDLFGDSRNFFVFPDHPQATDAGNTGENPQYPLATVARAIVLARAYYGDTIYVMSSNSWQYSNQTQTGVVESITIPYTKPGLRIVGVGYGGLPVYWQPAATTDFCITVEAMDTTIENFTFWGDGIAANGIYAEWDGATKLGENMAVHNCVFSDGCDIGIQLEYAWYNSISGCMFDTCDTYGVYSAAAGSGTAFNRIHDNVFHDCGTSAIALLGGGDDNHIYRNSIFNASAQAAAAAANEGINLTGGDDNQVFDNYFSCLLPVPANGDWDDLNTASATDAWIANWCMDGMTTTNPT